MIKKLCELHTHQLHPFIFFLQSTDYVLCCNDFGGGQNQLSSFSVVYNWTITLQATKIRINSNLKGTQEKLDST